MRVAQVQYYTAAEVAETLSVTVTSVYGWAKAGKLPSVTTAGGKVRLFAVSDVEKFATARGKAA